MLMAAPAFADVINVNSNSQHASNSASSEQAVAAISGDAEAEEGGIAESGVAVAAALSTQDDTIIQVGVNQLLTSPLPEPDEDIDVVNINENKQKASNKNKNEQAGAAISGNAEAEEDGIATSGPAIAVASSAQTKLIAQVGANQVDLSGLFPDVVLDAE
jgi:hypothetical protein